MTFVNLHTHSEHSILDGAARVKDLVSRAGALNQRALAITDHGSLSGAYDLYKECTSANIKPIIGCEFYFAPEGAGLKERLNWGELEGKAAPGGYTHLTVIARNASGLRNLYKLSRDACIDGFYFKPRIDLQNLDRRSSGLVVLSGCAGSVISTRIRLGYSSEAREHASSLKEIFGEHFYIEMMDHGIDFEKELNREAMELSKTLNIPVVATNDSHYVLSSDAAVHDALLCVQTRAQIKDQGRFRFTGSGFSLKSRDEMESLSLPRASLDTTVEIANTVESYSEVFEGELRMPVYEPAHDSEEWAEFYEDIMGVRNGGG